MKKMFILIIMLLLLVGCQKSSDEVNIVCPTGAPSIVFYKEIMDDNFETNNVPSDIIAMMSSDSAPDIVVIDTVGGINAIKKGANYSLAAIITFGNFYIASTGNDDDSVMDKDDRIVLFGQNQTPEIIFKYLYGSDFENIIYENNASDAARDLITGADLNGEKVDYVFIAEPALSTAKAKNPNVTVYANIQKIYSDKTGKSFIQAGLFVRNDKDLSNYLNELEERIDNLLVNQDELNELFKGNDEYVNAKYGIGISIINKVLSSNSINIGYKRALEIKDDIDVYMNVIGKEGTSEEIYYK